MLHQKKKLTPAKTSQKAERQNNILNQTKHPLKLHKRQSSIHNVYKLHINKEILKQTDESLRAQFKRENVM